MTEHEFEAAGWQKIAPKGHSGIVGPFWTKQSDGISVVALKAEERHCNSHLGTVHGGVLMTFADVGLGFSVVNTLGSPKCVTADLQIQFLSTAKVGEVMTCEAQVLRQTKELVFMRGTVSVHDKIIVAASGIWKIL